MRKIFDQDDATWNLLEEYRVKHGQRSLNAALGLMICNSKEGKPFLEPADFERKIEAVMPELMEQLQQVTAKNEARKPNPWAGVIGPTRAAPGSRLKQPKGKRK